MFKVIDRIFETSVTTGVGEYTLAGAQTGFQPFSVIGANNTAPYFATDDVNWEVAIGTYIAAPSRLQRTTILASSNGGAAVNWGDGTRKIRCGQPAALAAPRTLSKSVAGGAGDTALTADEQRRDILMFTGVLTGNRTVSVDDTPWNWIVYNNTTGAFTLTLKTTAGTGKAVTQGKRATLHCDGVNVEVSAELVMSPITNSLGADVALNNTANYFDGPSVAQGSAGVWFVIGAVAVVNNSSLTVFHLKLWDGTTLIASGIHNVSAGERAVVCLSGFISAPAGNLRISVRDPSTVNGKIVFNDSGNGKDSTITAIRIA